MLATRPEKRHLGLWNKIEYEFTLPGNDKTLCQTLLPIHHHQGIQSWIKGIDEQPQALRAGKIALLHLRTGHRVANAST